MSSSSATSTSSSSGGGVGGSGVGETTVGTRGSIISVGPSQHTEATEVLADTAISDDAEEIHTHEEEKHMARWTVQISEVRNLPHRCTTAQVKLSGPPWEQGVVVSTEEGSVLEDHSVSYDKDSSSFMLSSTKDPFDLNRLCNERLLLQLEETSTDTTSKTPTTQTLCVGTAQVDLTPLLHHTKQLDIQVPLRMDADYREHVLQLRQSKREEGEGVTYDERGENNSTEEAQTDTTRIRQVLIDVTITVNDLLAPKADHGEWNIIRLQIDGMYSLPSDLLAMIPSAGCHPAEDITADQQPFVYHARFLGLSCVGGRLQSPTAEDTPTEDSSTERKSIITEAELTDKPAIETKQPRISWEADDTTCFNQYCDRQFNLSLKSHLDTAGGAWLYVYPTVNQQYYDGGGGGWVNKQTIGKKSTAGNVQQGSDKGIVQERCRNLYGRAWIDMRCLLENSTTDMTGAFPVEGVNVSPTEVKPPRRMDEHNNTKDSYTQAQTYVRIELQIQNALHEEAPKLSNVDHIIPCRKPIPKLQSTEEALESLRICTRTGLSKIMNEFNALSCDEQRRAPFDTSIKDDIIEKLQNSGEYASIYQRLRKSTIKIIREKIRKDPRYYNMIRQSRQNGNSDGDNQHMKDTQFCDIFIYMSDHINEIIGQDIKRIEDSIDASIWQDPEIHKTEADESRLLRVKFDAEMCGNYTRADRAYKELLQSYGDSKCIYWFEYARFCLRRRGHSAVAEEALRKCIEIRGGESQATDNEILMLGSLLLDRQSYDEALVCYNIGLKRDPSNTIFLISIAVCYFLYKDFDHFDKFMQLSIRPSEYFILQDMHITTEKLVIQDFVNSCSVTDGPSREADKVCENTKRESLSKMKCSGDGSGAMGYSSNDEDIHSHLMFQPFEGAASHTPNPSSEDIPLILLIEMLLYFGLSDLITTIVYNNNNISNNNNNNNKINNYNNYNNNMFSETTMKSQRFNLCMAENMMLRKDFACAAIVLEELLSSCDRNQLGWRLLAECIYRTRDTHTAPRALEALRKAEAFTVKSDDSLSYIRKGQLLLELR
eukprot:GHVQ01040304.1.p1 GENE.GHVQ01040304.1~~GHVQ01040304.1.p1  ORF type:complete len:1084 (+),score=217.37 GHVQ01040304.1:97-3252(+)